MEKISGSLIKTNDNDNGLKTKTNDNDNVVMVCVDDIADRLVREFGSPQSRKFYCLVSWKINRDRIWQLVSIAKADGKTPGKLFNFLARQEINKATSRLQ